MVCNPSEDFKDLPTKASKNKEAGLAPLLLTVLELLRQLMEAQVIRRMEQELLCESDLDRAAESLQKLESQILDFCQIFEIEPSDLNVNLGDFGSLLPPSGSYYPGQTSNQASVVELLDRLLNTGVVVDGEIDIGLAQLDLIHAKLRLVLTAKTM
ncbi:gas vesicle protein K [Nodularia spumigena CS-584]|jgi:hypothetical protein|uniref:Gas vesicle protein K n=3 Tax=Nodularia spumigena TaxID=70799 RepID=A0A2S0Q680_NODSP|nr:MULTISPECIES: gas vesicle protein K [Cyanophyceae]MDB9356668.1 gas vesicle protein K [Nodularia spumigena CS-587/03]AHJ27877.1 gas vesicle protein [Nodularia spumigena CCY9414]AVZ29868.1 hypothetical protein BMF81_00831 [Nodularia spumigena UHCC 0039]EAW43905.1 gas vesicle protein [Nodularia spumigena CCY9414]KZL49103.1 protein gvpK [Nodularia spumigena CENA596]